MDTQFYDIYLEMVLQGFSELDWSESEQVWAGYDVALTATEEFPWDEIPTEIRPAVESGYCGVWLTLFAAQTVGQA